MTHYYYGRGKGKTSAAAGACIRALGHGMRCAFVQFHKNGSSGEISQLERLGADVFCAGDGIRFVRDMTEYEITAMTERHNRNLKCVSNGYDLVVLDELGDAVEHGTADTALVRDVLSCGAEIIVTGHKPTEMFMSSDYVTHFEAVSHPYKRGITARKGIEF